MRHVFSEYIFIQTKKVFFLTLNTVNLVLVFLKSGSVQVKIPETDLGFLRCKT